MLGHYSSYVIPPVDQVEGWETSPHPRDIHCQAEWCIQVKMVSWRFIPQKPVKSEKEILRLTLYSRYKASIFCWNWASKCFFSSPTRVWIKWVPNENLQNSWKRTKTNKSWSGNEAYKEYKVRWYVVLTKTLKLPTDKI